MPLTKLTFTGELTVCSCWCGIRLAIPDSLFKAGHESGRPIFCPLGPEFVWKDSENDALRKEAARQKKLHEWAESRAEALRDQLQASERSKAALKGHLTRARNKIAAGVCPVPDCHLHFSNVREHMKFKHPDYALTDPETGLVAEL